MASDVIDSTGLGEETARGGFQSPKEAAAQPSGRAGNLDGAAAEASKDSSEPAEPSGPQTGLESSQGVPGRDGLTKPQLRTRQPVDYKDNVNWDRLTLSEFSDEGDDERPAKRVKGAHGAASVSAEWHLEEETAWAVGFNASSISAEEEDLLPPGGNEATYAQARNYVLTLWRADVSRWMSEEEATTRCPWRLRPYIPVAWRFLNTAGYINFGVGSGVMQRARAAPQARGTVIVIGAGLAGMATARQLQSFGHKVVVLEGKDHPGGRVYSKRLQGDGFAAVADLGGSVITGIDGNPLAVLAKQLAIPLLDINTAHVPLFMADGSLADPVLDKQVEEMSNRLLDECSRLRDSMGDLAENISLGTALETLWADIRSDGEASEQAEEEGRSQEREVYKRRLLDWHLANLEFANAQRLARLSMRSWDQDDPHEVHGAHTFLPGGNLRLIAAMAQGVPVFYNSVVSSILYSEEGVSVATETRDFQADAVVVTVPLGVLKKGIIRFEPPLPQRKQEAINRLGFGVLNKVVLLFPEVFWPEKEDMFGRVADTTSERGEFYLFYSYAHISGGPLLAALVSGDAAEAFEALPAAEAVERVMQVLRATYTPRGVDVPDPVQAVCTRWGADPLTYGSYSSLGVGGLGGEDYDLLAESVAGRLFFAGEATTKMYPATMHGAFFTGLREAANVSASLAKQRALEREAAMAKEAKAFVAPTKQEIAVQAEEVRATLEATIQLAKAVASVFENPAHPPDAEFGCFAVVYGPEGSQYEDLALLRFDIGEAQGRGRASKRTSMPLVVPLNRSQAYRLQDVSGGDDARLNFLAKELDLKLVGRSGLDERSQSLLQALLQSRQQADAVGPATASLSAADTEVRADGLTQGFTEV